MGNRTLSVLLPAILVGGMLLPLCPLRADGEADISYIELRHRRAEDILPLLQPFLAGQAVAIPNGGQLILKASPELTGEIRQLVEQLDKPLHRFLISVRQGRDLAKQQEGMGMSGQIDIDHPDESEFYGHVYDTRELQDNQAMQRVQALEGQPARIETGTNYPLQQQQVWRNGHQVIVNRSQYYQPVTSGFAVIPRLTGNNQVILDIMPWSDELSSRGSIATQNVQTSLQAPLGQWVNIGGGREETSLDQHGFTEKRYQTGQKNYQVWLKVELLP